MSTATGLIRAAFQEEQHAHHDEQRPHLVPPAEPPVRRRRRTLQLLLSHLGISGPVLAACIAPAAAWTAAMITLALAVRF